jgi:hypothetical protein
MKGTGHCPMIQTEIITRIAIVVHRKMVKNGERNMEGKMAQLTCWDTGKIIVDQVTYD